MAGTGTPRSWVKALKWFRRSCDQRLIDGLHSIDLMHANGPEGIERNEAEAIKWIRRVAERGVWDAMTHLGSCHLFGMCSIKQNPAEAFRWYQRAADASDGNTNAMLLLGLCHFAGAGVPDNATLGLKWMQHASNRGNEEASRFIAMVRQGKRRPGIGIKGWHALPVIMDGGPVDEEVAIEDQRGKAVAVVASKKDAEAAKSACQG